MSMGNKEGDRSIEARSARATLTIWMSVAIAACGGIGDGVEVGDAGLGDELACAEDEACTPAIPAGWRGPVALAANQPCPETMPDELFVSHTTLDVPEISCECSCGSPSEVGCSGPVVLAAREVECKQEDFFPSLVPFKAGATVNVKPQSARSWATTLSTHPLPEVTAGICEPIAEVSIPEPSFRNELRTCAPAADPSACEERGACLREPATPICIFQEGETECPAGPYSERTVSYQAIEDSRACSSCECGPAEGVCDGPITFSIEDTTVFQQFDPSTSCIDLPFTPTHGGHAIAGSPATESAICQATTSTPSGTALPAAPMTTCCLPQ
jgi:hypothetical protein